MQIKDFHAWIDQVQGYESIDLYNMALFHKSDKKLERDQIVYIVWKLFDRKEHDLIYSLAINLI